MIALLLAAGAAGADFALEVVRQTPVAPGAANWRRVAVAENWPAGETAVIVCDVWDCHHSRNASARLEEFVGRLNQFVERCRADGAAVVHAPSDCMKSYEEHPARRRARAVPRAPNLPKDVGNWCKHIPAEDAGAYPLDQSDGGADDDVADQRRWEADLKARGRDPALPWRFEHPAVKIDGERDYLTDRGEEVWSILHARGVKNVLMVGVHANMCVLGRPFGLRRLAAGGIRAALVRDLTDTMYNPQRRPFVSHFTGTDLILDHIERHVGGTVTSDQLLGGAPFRFAADRRPTAALVSSEPEYQTARTLPAFAAAALGKDFRTRLAFGSADDGADLPGLETALAEADVLLLSVRRQALRPAQLAAVRRFVAAGKGVVGIRTASHAFDLRGAAPPAGRELWPEFDAAVFGGNYAGHTGVRTAESGRGRWAGNSPLLDGLDRRPFALGSHLYLATPLAAGVEPLAYGIVAGHPEQPLAWTFRRADGGKSFYTSLGAPKDFEGNPEFPKLLANALKWAAVK